MMMNLTFAFYDHPTSGMLVLLLRKRIRSSVPAHNGLLNGLGGKMEPGETSLQGAVREFNEESGLAISDHRFVYRGLFAWNWGVVSVWSLRLTREEFEIIMATSSPADEVVGAYVVDTIGVRQDLAPGVDWLVPLAADHNVDAFIVTTS
jgi:8-oxo-dGTP pyrophosphatase MutT (NUDIX family)